MVILLFAVVSLLVPLLAFAQEFKKGDQATVPDWTWVEVKNLDPGVVWNGNSSFGYGDPCGIQRGGIVTVVGIGWGASPRPLLNRWPPIWHILSDRGYLLHHEENVLRDDGRVQSNPCGRAERKRPHQEAHQELASVRSSYHQFF